MQLVLTSSTAMYSIRSSYLST